MRAVDALGHALAVAGSMTWQILWSLIVGFTLSAIIQAVVRPETIARLLGADRPRALALATGSVPPRRRAPGAGHEPGHEQADPAAGGRARRLHPPHGAGITEQ